MLFKTVIDSIMDEQRRSITHNYLFECIQYEMNDAKKRAIELYLEKVKNLENSLRIT